MFDSLLADGLGSGLAEKAAGYVIKGLAVAGGFLIGYFLGKVVAWGLDRWVFANKAPDQLKKAVSLVSGIALAILVAILVFGDGGNGFGLGGGTGDGKGTTPADDGKSTTPPAEPKDPTPPKPPVEPPPKLPPPKPTPGDVRVAILGGEEVRDGRFYVIDDDPSPRTFDEFKEALTARRKTAKSELMVIFRFKKEPLSDNHPAVRQAVGWVNQEKLPNRFE